jgi:putative SOS response-associated peptidase YedK
MTAQGLICNREDRRNIAVADLFWGIRTKDKKLIINARAEAITESTMFSDSISNRRCILPSTGFYEWDKNKTKFVFKREDEKPLYLAGFYDLSENRDSFVILTTAANASMEPVHDRMPVIIDKRNIEDYLKDSSAAMEIINAPMPMLSRNSDYEQLSLFG